MSWERGVLPGYAYRAAQTLNSVFHHLHHDALFSPDENKTVILFSLSNPSTLPAHFPHIPHKNTHTPSLWFNTTVSSSRFWPPESRKTKHTETKTWDTVTRSFVVVNMLANGCLVTQPADTKRHENLSPMFSQRLEPFLSPQTSEKHIWISCTRGRL